MKKTTFMLLLTLIVSMISVEAQQAFNSKESKNSAVWHVESLKSGVLLVRLPSNRKKIAALENTLAQDLSEKDVKNVSKMLEKTREETEKLHADIIDAMESIYTFSDHAFFLDYDTHEVLEGNGKLYQSDLKTPFELSDSISVHILSVGRTPDNVINAFMVLDSDLQNIERPFPGSISRSGLAGLFGNDKSHIKRLNTKLWRYFNSIMLQQSNQ